MKIEVKVPSVGESVNTAEIESWEKKSGDLVTKGDILVILETDKASMEVPADQSGLLSILKKKGDTVSVDEVIAFIDTSATADLKKNSTLSNDSENKKTKKEEVKQALDTSQASKSYKDKEYLSPAVRRLVDEKKLNPSQIEGTGRGGRLTKEDILKALNERSTSTNETNLSPDLLDQKTEVSLKKGQSVEPMTRLRRITAEKLVQSQHNTATLSTFNEVDLSRIIEIRKNYQESFVKKYSYKLGFMSFFVKAVISALKEYPKINAFTEGDNIIYNDHQHIGIAVSTEKGLVVPVLFFAETLNLAQIEKQIINYKEKALSRKLTPDDLLGGTFTISNGGVFGSLISTPILNPPQSGILGMHKIEQRPVVREAKIEIRPMMYLTLSYDHRIVDGRESVGFLVKVKEGLEEPARLLINF
ncbi:MAG: 2-oxoglutarate dehydrogenase complex dihydrolipoyllysine-residue succinyltransferase [Bdellovibrionaceae bacterium]|nr:2-oxoglutarate dehydrogenase complex dihydrolipoyllysine-residue succinyltransferase [Pseudobdellovibrionaceae bacterium]